MDPDFKVRLKSAMDKNNMAAADLSRSSGVGKDEISRYLKGEYAPKQHKCYLLAKALNVDPGWLMTGEEPIRETFSIADFLAGSSMPLSLDDLPALWKKLSPSTPKEDAEMSILWQTATPQAKRAAIAVLRSMKEAELE